MLLPRRLKTVIPSLSTITVHGPWSRAIAYHHLISGPSAPGSGPQPLWAGGPAINGARFTPKGGFDSIYLADDLVTAFQEVRAFFQHPGAPPFTMKLPPWALFTVDGVLHNILDLTDPHTLSSLGTSLQELTGRWSAGSAGGLAPTQVLAQAAYDLGSIVGFRYQSAQNAGGICVVVFTDRLTASSHSYIEVYDPFNNLIQRLP